MPAPRRRPAPPSVAQSLRVFFALWPGEEVRGRLDDWAEAMKAQTGGRRIRTENLHVTLAFLGMLPLARIGEVNDIALNLEAPPFELVFDRPGWWKHNELAWLGTSTVPPGLTVLAEGLRARLSSEGLPFDRKPYVPHVTLVRDAARPASLPSLPSVTWAVSSYALMQSTGGRYTVVSTFPLIY